MRTLSVILLFAVAVSSGTAQVAQSTRVELPEVFMEMKDGWIRLRIVDNGNPVSGAKVQCLVGTQVWASGETDADGRGEFPRPTGEWCQLVIDLGAGPSAPIPLSFLKDGTVIPLSSNIRDGTAACCVLPKLTPTHELASDNSLNLPWFQLFTCLGIVVLAFLAWRWSAARSSGTPNTIHSKWKHNP
jgi:hypothetical protein